MKRINDRHRSGKAWFAAGISSLALAIAVTGGAWVNADQERSAPLADLTPQQHEAIESANHLSGAFRAVANNLLPSVVAIENRPAVAWTGGNQQPADDNQLDNPFKGTPFEDLFNDPRFRKPRGGGQRAIPSPRQRSGIGSGVIIDPSGIILTNNHVVAGGGEVMVRTQDGREFVATEVWTDPKTDVAVVKIDGASDLVAATLGDSDNIEIGDWVLALGQPFGLESTVTAGIISAKHRGIGITARENFLQTDAAINPGNSGGPLVSLRGKVIGINTAIHSRSGGNNGIGFAIPSNLARWVSDQLVNTGTVRRAYLGVGIQPITQELGKQLGVRPRQGVVVTDVYPDTPASKAGLKSGDVIVRFGGEKITSPQGLQLSVERSPIGEKLPIKIVRDGKEMEVMYEAAEPQGEFAAKLDTTPDGKPTGKRMENLGLEIAPLTSEVAKQLNLDNDQGVVITSVRKGSPAASVGLTSGMVIAEVNRQSVSTVAEFEAAIESAQQDDTGRGVLLLVRSENGSRFVVIKP